MRKIEVIILLLASLLFFAIPCASQTIPTRQQQIDAHMKAAQADLSQNRPDLAVAEFKAIIALDPKNVDARGNLGVVLFFQGRYADSIPHLRAALKMQPSLWKIQALLGIAEKRTGDISNATSDLEKAFPHVKEQKIQIETGMELIDIYSATGDLPKAVPVISALREVDPTNVEIIYTAYRIYSDLLDETRLSLTVAGPNSARVHQMMAHELARQGHTEEAIANYREALKADPNASGLHFELAEMLNNSGLPNAREEAEKEYLAALAVNPNDEKAECKLGDLAAMRNDQKTAAEHYERALKIQPNDSEAMIGFADQDDHEPARESAAALGTGGKARPDQCGSPFSVEHAVPKNGSHTRCKSRTSGIPEIKSDERKAARYVPGDALKSGKARSRRRLKQLAHGTGFYVF